MDAIDKIMVLIAKQTVKDICPAVLLMDDAGLLAALKKRFALAFDGDSFVLVPIRK